MPNSLTIARYLSITMVIVGSCLAIASVDSADGTIYHLAIGGLLGVSGFLLGALVDAHEKLIKYEKNT